MSKRVSQDAQCINLAERGSTLDKAPPFRGATRPSLSLDQHEPIFEQSAQVPPLRGPASTIPGTRQLWRPLRRVDRGEVAPPEWIVRAVCAATGVLQARMHRISGQLLSIIAGRIKLHVGRT